MLILFHDRHGPEIPLGHSFRDRNPFGIRTHSEDRTLYNLPNRQGLRVIAMLEILRQSHGEISEPLLVYCPH